MRTHYLKETFMFAKFIPEYHFSIDSAQQTIALKPTKSTIRKAYVRAFGPMVVFYGFLAIVGLVMKAKENHDYEEHTLHLTEYPDPS